MALHRLREPNMGTCLRKHYWGENDGDKRYGHFKKLRWTPPKSVSPSFYYESAHWTSLSNSKCAKWKCSNVKLLSVTYSAAEVSRAVLTPLSPVSDPEAGPLREASVRGKSTQTDVALFNPAKVNSGQRNEETLAFASSSGCFCANKGQMRTRGAWILKHAPETQRSITHETQITTSFQ